MHCSLASVLVACLPLLPSVEYQPNCAGAILKHLLATDTLIRERKYNVNRDDQLCNSLQKYMYFIGDEKVCLCALGL